MRTFTNLTCPNYNGPKKEEMSTNACKDFMNAPFSANCSKLKKGIVAFFVPTVMLHVLPYKRLTMSVVITN